MSKFGKDPYTVNLEPLLSYIKQYVELSPEEQAVLSGHINFRKYLKNQYVVQEGDVCKTENFVVKGCLKTFFTDSDGQEHIVMFGIENWWVSDLGSFISQEPAKYNVQCIEPCELIQFTYDNLEALYLKVPKMERFFRIILQKAYVASANRVIQNFSESARDRYIAFRKKYPEIDQRVPQYMIASYLGITKEFLSKIRSQLIHEQ